MSMPPELFGHQRDALVPPPGPGAVPPFVAPPTDGSRKRRWIGLGVGAGVLVLCLTGGVVGIGALVVSSEAARREAATTVVRRYLTDWRQRDYSKAYDLVCDDVKERTSLREFSAELSAGDLDGFELQTVQLTTTRTVVPATLHFADTPTRIERFEVVSDSGGTSLVCGSD